MADNSNDDDIPEHCFLEVSIAGDEPQQIVIQLYRNAVPKTCKNFVTLCDTAKDIRTSQRAPYPTYRGCIFHRIIKDFMVQSGDFENFNGTGGYSPLSSDGSGKLNDESFAITHNEPGIVSMANSGRNTNKSQFFITLKSTPHLNGKHVAFGKVIKGMEIVNKMVSVELDGNNKPVPLQRISITDCGVVNNNIDSLARRDEANKNVKKSRDNTSIVSEKDQSSNKRRSKSENDSSSDSSSSEEDIGDRKEHKRKRRRRKEHRRSGNDSRQSKHKHKKKRKKKDHSSSSSSSSSSEDDSSSDDEDDRPEKKQRKRKSKHHRYRKNKKYSSR